MGKKEFNQKKMNLKKSFKTWRRKRNKSRILKLAQGDNNLIAVLSKARKYVVAVFEYVGVGKFRQIGKAKLFSQRSQAERHFKKIVEEF